VGLDFHFRVSKMIYLMTMKTFDAQQKGHDWGLPSGVTNVISSNSKYQA
jgi:hypothetical protein